MKLVNFNARCLSNKFAQLSDFVAEEDPDIITISESWLTSDIPSQEFTPANYCCFRLDRNINFYTQGTYQRDARGGVLILAKSSLDPTALDEGSVEAEILWIKICPSQNTPIAIGVCYRPETDELPIISKINQSITSICQTENDVILTGDFNFRNISWVNLAASNEIEQTFLDSLSENFLTQMVDEPTRGDNILDLLITNNPDLFSSVAVQPPFSNSDHNTICAEFESLQPRVETSRRRVYKYTEGDFLKMNRLIAAIDWRSLFNTKNINECWDIFKTQYTTLVDECIPFTNLSPGRRSGAPWTRYPSVKKAKRKKRKAFTNHRSSGRETDRILLEEAKRNYNQAIQDAKAHYEGKLTSQIKTDPKRFWNYTKHFTRSSSTVDSLKENGSIITNDDTKAEIFNRYFASVWTQETDQAPDTDGPAVEDILNNVHITPNKVRKKLSRLKKNKSSGPDSININVLRSCPNFDIPLALLYSKSLDSSSIPDDWLHANVMPLHKKGPRTNSANYRPISLTSQVVKIFEKIILDTIKPHLNRTGLIQPCQHGFQQKASCISQLLECMENWTQNLDKKLETDIIYLDFAKAFDTVPHNRLLSKLSHAGISGKLLTWLRLFLTNRYQRVQLRNGCSSWIKVKSGVPQGSILGPTLFLIYINDLPMNIESNIKLFADDTKLYSSISSPADCLKLQEDLDTLSEWSRNWLLSFNETKCVVLKIRKSLDFTYSMNNIPLDEVDNQKDLGVYISDNLHPRYHIQEITKSASKRIGLIKRCFSNRSPDIISTLYKSIVRPVLEYGSPIWSPWHKKDIDTLDKIQDRCVRLANPRPTMSTLTRRRKISDLVEVYKLINGHYKTDYQTFFSISQRPLRGHRLKLKKSHCRTDTRKFWFGNRIIDQWNSLPEEVVTAPSLDSFKKRMKSLPLD